MASVASTALAVPAIVESVFFHLALGAKATAETERRLPAHYQVLRQASLVCRAWVNPAKQLLFAVLYFSGGTKQLQCWLDAVGPGPVQYSSDRVVFEDKLPFREGKDGKWDFGVVRKVLQKVEGVQALWLYFQGQKELPAELLLDDGLKGLKVLIIGSPLSTPPPKVTPPFEHLETLVPVDDYPKLERDWSSTFSFLAGTANTSPPLHPRTLDLSCLPSFATYLFPALTPFAASIYMLQLPSLTYTPELWRLLIFAQNCRHLQRLYIKLLTPASSANLKLLVSFPPGLSHLHFGSVYGSLGGHYDLSPGAADLDTWQALLRLVADFAGLRVLQIGYARFLYPSHQAELEKLAKAKGFGVYVDAFDNSYSAAEEKQFAEIVQSSIKQSLGPKDGEPAAATQGETEEGIKAGEQDADGDALGGEQVVYEA
ncbi:hypothetical protein JCM1841_002937 [Sporobolomyces salmonicolor]